MTWALPFLFIRYIVQSGIPAEFAGVALRFLLLFFLGSLALFLMQGAVRRYFLSSHQLSSHQARRARIAHTFRGGS